MVLKEEEREVMEKGRIGALLLSVDAGRKDKNPNSDRLKDSDDVFKDLEKQMLKNLKLSLDKSLRLIADFADSSDHKEKSNAAGDEGTSGCGSQSLAPPTSGTGLDLSGSDEWMVL